MPPSEGNPDGLIPEAFVDEVIKRLMAEPRRIEAQGRRLNAKPKRPSGYIYVYPERLVGTQLTGREWDIIFLLTSRSDGKGLIVYSASEVAKTMELKPTQLHYHLRRILTVGVLERVGRGALQMNPRMMWHGSSSTQNDLLGERLAERTREELREAGYIA